MANQELVDFVKKQRERGVTPTDIEKALQDVGWSDQDVHDALSQAGIGMSPKPASSVAAPSPLSSPDTSMPTTAAAQTEKEPVDLFKEVDAAAQSTALATTTVSSATTSPLTAAQHAAAPGAVEYQEGMSLKKKVAVFAAIVVAVAVIVAAAVFAYFRFYQSPARIGTLLVGNIASLTSARMDISIDQTLKSGNTVVEEHSTKIMGDTTVFTSELPATTLSVQWESTANGVKQEDGINLKSTEGKNYVQITSAGSDESLTALIDALNGRWITIEPKDDSTTAIPIFAEGIVTTTGVLTAAEQGIIRDAFRSSPPLKLTNQIDTAVIDSTKTYHDRFEIDKGELKKFIAAIAPVLKAHGRTDTSINATIKGVDSWDSIGGEVWIGAKDYQLYRADITATGTRSANRTEVWKTTVKLSKHNEPITVEAPTDVITLQQLLEVVATPDQPVVPVPDVTTPPVTETKKDTDGDGLIDTKEVEYGTNSTDPDSDGDGYLDGEEVKNGYNPLGAGALETK